MVRYIYRFLSACCAYTHRKDYYTPHQYCGFVYKAITVGYIGKKKSPHISLSLSFASIWIFCVYIFLFFYLYRKGRNKNKNRSRFFFVERYRSCVRAGIKRRAKRSASRAGINRRGTPCVCNNHHTQRRCRTRREREKWLMSDQGIFPLYE